MYNFLKFLCFIIFVKHKLNLSVAAWALSACVISLRELSCAILSDSEGDPENVSNNNDPQTASVETGDSDQLAIGGAEEPNERLKPETH